MKICTVYKEDRTVKGMILLPASKSISNRLLIIRSLSETGFRIANLSAADDTALLTQHLATINRHQGSSTVCTLDTHNAGTVMRFLTAYLAVKPGSWTLVGSERMYERPIGLLVEALINLGADIEYLGTSGFPPLKITGRSLRGGDLQVDASVSSQFISALLMIAPILPGGLSLTMTEKPVSDPYIEMTIRLMEKFGIDLHQEQNMIRVKSGKYKGADYTVEADWSSAAFCYEVVALSANSELHLPGLLLPSIQGDAVLPIVYKALGVQTEKTLHGIILTKKEMGTDLFRYDFRGCPDIAPVVITTCAALKIKGKFHGLKGLNIKETNRITALVNELRKIGIILEVTGEGDRIDLVEESQASLSQYANIVFESYDDHRMIMTFAPLALMLGSVRVANPDAVSKSYPGFWEEMTKVGFKVRGER
ncbi:MAG: 3-phosphoshikimate 1-carboxyvinyltransferase [Bacteroidales bacterium]|nr:3-phosphoshikimate 1-carboxyvinyltransferase [Bacteroidota bacterium]MBL6950720.1 3-phosphoshikimate 1-carboxyvinyltransferase [Bacteroidales bacterium]